MEHSKFLLINTIGNGFWYDLHNTLSQLLLAEITHRIPVVFWGCKSMYSTDEASNAFEQYFLPVSECGMDKLLEGINSDADIQVADIYTEMETVKSRMDDKCTYYRLNSEELYRCMLKKYIRLRPEILVEINDFYNKNMKGNTHIAVHIRGSDKILEVRHLHELNKLYKGKINRLLEEKPNACIFMMTDCKDILGEYIDVYGDKVIYTNCKRVMRSDTGVHFQKYENNKLKGIEIIKDTWLASRCDYFIGNGFSNVSRAIYELKDWQDNKVTLFF